MASIWVRLLVSLMSVLPLGILYSFYKLFDTFELLYVVVFVVLVLVLLVLHGVVVPHILNKLEELKVKIDSSPTEVTYKKAMFLGITYVLTLLLGPNISVVSVASLLFLLVVPLLRLYFCDPVSVVFFGWRSYVITTRSGTRFLLFSRRELRDGDVEPLVVCELGNHLLVDKRNCYT